MTLAGNVYGLGIDEIVIRRLPRFHRPALVPNR